MTNNLPRYATPMLGREREAGEIARAVEQAPLVTIVGAGGIGKTRVAVSVASGHGADVSGGKWFVDLAPLSDPTLIPATVANAIGLDMGESSDPTAALVTELASRHLVIVLDNCEHVLERCAAFARALVASAPHVRVLATSREPLGVSGEIVYRLDALDAPAGIALFKECARRAVSDIDFAPGDDALIAEICTRLDGIALAIELIAARVSQMPLKTLLSRLDERYWAQTDASPSALQQKHPTLRSLIDWSHELLTDDQKKLFRRLGVFRGGFSLEAARRVAGYDSTTAGPTLMALVDKSMVVSSLGHAPRYRLLEPIRHYAARQFRESGDADHTRRVHATYFAQLSGEAAARFGFDSEESWLALYEPDIDNFRAAMEWSLRAEPSVAASIVGNLKEFWYHSNLISEGLARSQAVVAALDPEDEEALFPVLLSVGTLAWRVGEARYSCQAGEQALAIALRSGDPSGIATARYVLGWAFFKIGETGRAARELQQAVEFFRTLDQPLRLLLVSIDYAIALKRTDPERGYAMIQEALSVAENSRWPRATMRAQIALAEYEFLRGDSASAIVRARHVLEISRMRNSWYSIGVALNNLSSYLCIARDYADARELAREAIEAGRTHRISVLAEWALQSFAVCLAAEGSPRIAARLLGHVDAYVEAIGSKREPTESLVQDRLLELLDQHLDRATIAQELALGRKLTEERACALALNEDT